MKSIVTQALSVATLLALTGCSTTQFTSTWKAPDATLQPIEPGAKVGALVLYPKVAVEHSAEDALAAALTQRGVVGIPAYTLLGDTNPTSEAEAKAAFAGAGAVAVVVMRGVEVRNQEVFNNPSVADPVVDPASRAFWGGYYSRNWTTATDPDYLKTARLVSVETMVFDLKSNKLVWSGRSQTVEPGQLDTFIQEVVAQAAKEMRKDGLL
ncbi:MAG: hypothetical protein MUC91_03960 [Verrucomicrobia bacterium]|jgi:hypothetical protein|nr:hypothetical protein [Verrucomicrobiota bacterium]